MKGERYWAGADEFGRTITNPQTAEDILGMMWYEINRGRFDPTRYKKKAQRKFRFTEAMKAHLDYERHRLSVGEIRETTFEAKKNRLAKITPLIGLMDIPDIGEFELERWPLELLKELSPVRVADIFKALHSFFKWAKRNKLIEGIPDRPSIKQSKPGQPDEWLDEEAQNKVLDKIPWNERGIWLFLIYQAVRLSEAVALQWDDVDLESGLVTIRRSVDWKSRRMRPPKTGKARVLPIHPIVMGWLNNHRDMGFVFLRRRRPYTQSTLHRIWRKACEAAGVTYISPYRATRHSWASQRMAEGHNIYDVSKTLGHASVRTTERYTHPSLEAGRRTILGKILRIDHTASSQDSGSGRKGKNIE